MSSATARLPADRPVPTRCRSTTQPRIAGLLQGEILRLEHVRADHLRRGNRIKPSDVLGTVSQSIPSWSNWRAGGVKRSVRRGEIFPAGPLSRGHDTRRSESLPPRPMTRRSMDLRGYNMSPQGNSMAMHQGRSAGTPITHPRTVIMRGGPLMVIQRDGWLRRASTPRLAAVPRGFRLTEAGTITQASG